MAQVPAINVENMKAQAREWIALKRNEETVEGSTQNMVAKMIRLAKADQHISTWAGIIHDESVDDTERNRFLTSFRGQLKRGAEASDGERGAMKRDAIKRELVEGDGEVECYPTVKSKQGSYIAVWKATPEGDQLKKDALAAFATWWKAPNSVEAKQALADMLKAMESHKGDTIDAMHKEQERAIEQHEQDVEAAEASESDAADAFDALQSEDVDAVDQFIRGVGAIVDGTRTH